MSRFEYYTSHLAIDSLLPRTVVGPHGELVMVRLSPWHAAPSATTSSLRVTVSPRFIPEGFATIIDDNDDNDDVVVHGGGGVFVDVV